MSLLDTAPQRMGAFAREGTKTYRAHRVYDKLAFLVGITVVSGALCASVVGTSSTVAGLLIPAMLVAIGCALAGTFKPNLAKTLAPIYAIAEGAVLGAVSKAYSNVAGGIVPTAIVLTAGLFIGCLFVFRTGIVKVTPRFVSMISVGLSVLFVLYLAALFGLAVPGIRDIGGPKAMIFGFLGLALGLGRLFIDFDRVAQFEGASADGAGRMTDSAEWYLSFQLLLSLVMIYVNVLRILAANANRR